MDYVKSIRAKLGHQKIILNCAGVVIEKDGRILFQRRSDNNRWGLIGGLLELDETYEEAAIREAKEETGLDVQLTAFLGIFHNHNMVWSNGDQYVGMWKADKPNGKGKLTTKAGDTFEGMFKNGKIDGEGIARYADGSKFKGTFKNGKRNGTAIEEDKDGKRFEGSYKDDIRDGKFVEKDRNGNVIARGTYTRGHRQQE